MLRALAVRGRVDRRGGSRDRRQSRYPVLRHMVMDAPGVCAYKPRAWSVIVLWHEFMALVCVHRPAVDPHGVHALCAPGVVAPRDPPPSPAHSLWGLHRNHLCIFVPAAQRSTLFAAPGAVATLSSSTRAPLGVKSTYHLLTRCLCSFAALDAYVAHPTGTRACVRVCFSCTCSSASDDVPPYPEPQHVAAPQCRVSHAMSFDTMAKSYACTAFGGGRGKWRYRPCMVPGMSAAVCRRPRRRPVLGPVRLLLPRSCDLYSHAISSDGGPVVSTHVPNLFCTQSGTRSRVAASVAFPLGRLLFPPCEYIGQRSFLYTWVPT